MDYIKSILQKTQTRKAQAVVQPSPQANPFQPLETQSPQTMPLMMAPQPQPVPMGAQMPVDPRLVQLQMLQQQQAQQATLAQPKDLRLVKSPAVPFLSAS